ncbi:Hypothetical predicted protein [Octopus vulgaris]|uniref:Uncharacterized protein n=1 Tax=Octopus vulgaris TaxID=6645 RepID=A0AA36FID0_OCTVU|nr:Hypothetical predicted protein [Octopus vulgaris]
MYRLEFESTEKSSQQVSKIIWLQGEQLPASLTEERPASLPIDEFSDDEDDTMLTVSSGDEQSDSGTEQNTPCSRLDNGASCTNTSTLWCRRIDRLKMSWRMCRVEAVREFEYLALSNFVNSNNASKGSRCSQLYFQSNLAL